MKIDSSTEIISKRFFLIFGLLFLFYFSHYLILGKGSYILIHDNLNQINMLGIFDGKFSSALFPAQVGEHFTLPGADQLFHLAQIKLDKLIYSAGYFPGFLINELLVRLFAFAGFFLMTKKLVPASGLNNLMIGLISFTFSTQPFWPQGYLSIAGIPLLIFAFLDLYKGKWCVRSFLIITIYCLYSNFFLSGIYLTLFLSIILIYLIVKKRKLEPFISGILVFIVLNIVSNLAVFLNFFIYKIPTNRIAQDLSALNLIDSIKTMVTIFIQSSDLAKSRHTLMILPFFIVITIFAFKKRELFRKEILSILLMILTLTFIAGIYFWEPILQAYNSLQIGFNFSRIYVLNSVLWFLLWLYCLIIFKRIVSKQTFKVIFLTMIIFQCSLNFRGYTLRGFTGKPSFREFTAESQFDMIKQEIPEICNSRIGCIGFYPAVANYNGLKTVGSFSAYYPLSYKDKFRKIIFKEIEDNTVLLNYFENKGSALYLFDDEIGFKYRDQEELKRTVESITCNLDFYELKLIPVEYIISTVIITNANEKGLQNLLIENEANSYYNFFVYKIQ